MFGTLASYSQRLPYSKWKVRSGRILAMLLAHMGCNVVVPIKMRNGSILVLDARGRSEGESFWQGTFDPCLVNFLIRCSKVYGSQVVDIGANVGLIAIPLAVAGAHVDAVEPIPVNAERIREAARLSGVEDRVVVHEIALGNSPGSMTLIMETGFGSTTGNAAATGVSDARGMAFDVSVQRLDDLSLLRVDVIKIDVEGAELGVLQGTIGIIERDRPVIVGEYHSVLVGRFGYSYLDVADLLKPFGYRHFAFRSETELEEITPAIGRGNTVVVPEEKVPMLPGFSLPI